MHKLKLLFEKYESVLSSLTLILGFIFDYLTLHRVDFLLDNLFIILYLVFAGASILVINFHEAGRMRNKFVESIYTFLPFILQFAFGGLFSAFVIFYSKSASLFTSGAFVLILLTLLIGNEFFKNKYSKLVFQVGIYFVALFSFAIYFLPVLTKQMGALIFLGSGAISLTLIILFIFIISIAARARYKESERFLVSTILCLYLSINVLYFTNTIPPIPLSLKIGDVFHSVERQVDGNYMVTGEKNAWQEKFNLAQKIHLGVGEPVYVFSSVFAPTNLNIRIIHNWQYFNESEGKWVSSNEISFLIQGGRNDGYRGFSRKDYVFPGKWRVDIKTERGQVIGRVRFDIDIGSPALELESKII